MQVFRLHKNIYNLYSYARTQECLDFYRNQYQEKIKQWELLKDEGCSLEAAQAILGFSRATYYRMKKVLKDLDKGISPPSKRPKNLNKPRWGESEKQWVLRIRRENPTYGKEKIGTILRRDHAQTISNSTVGRILTHLKQKGLIQTSASAPRNKRKRKFNKHATAWTFKDYKTMEIGERIQIDHMTVSKNQITFKHFQAWDRKSKYIDARVYSNAKSSSAKRFLMEFVKNAPFKVHSIQVDGGSEFMDQFEDACAQLKIPLIVLPPRKPEYNGGVERGNRIFREEFYYQRNLLAHSIGDMNYELKRALQKYNHYRPHYSLKNLTPIQYLESNSNVSTLLAA